MSSNAAITEAEILERILASHKGTFAPETARELLALSFDRPTKMRIRQLLRKNNRGAISAAERITLEKYIRVGQLVDLLQAKARLSLKPTETGR